MKFRLAFKAHSSLFVPGTRHILSLAGLVHFSTTSNMMKVAPLYADAPEPLYISSDYFVNNGWNNISLEGDGERVVLKVNGYNFTLVDVTKYIESKRYYGFDTNVYMTIPNTSSIASASSWEQQWHVRTNATASSTSTSGHHSQYINSGGTALYCDFGIQQGYWNLFLSSNGYSWNIVNGVGRNVRVMDSTGYLINLAFTGSQYIMKGSTNLGASWTTLDTYSSSTKVYSVSSTRVGNSNDKSWPWQDSIYIDKYSFIKTDGTLIFDGSTAVEGVDFTNNGCSSQTERIYPYTYPTFKVGDLTLYGNNWLVLKDIEAVKVEDDE